MFHVMTKILISNNSLAMKMVALYAYLPIYVKSYTAWRGIVAWCHTYTQAVSLVPAGAQSTPAGLCREFTISIGLL